MYRVIPYIHYYGRIVRFLLPITFLRVIKFRDCASISKPERSRNTGFFFYLSIYLAKNSPRITLDILIYRDFYLILHLSDYPLCPSIIRRFNYYSKLHYTPFLDIKRKLRDTRREREIILFKSRKIQYPFAINQKSGKMPIIPEMHKIIPLMYLSRAKINYLN